MFSAVYWAAHYELLLHHLNSLFIQKVQKSVNGALRVCCNLQKHILHIAVLRQTPQPRLCHAHLSQCWRAKLTALLSSWLISPAPRDANGSWAYAQWMQWINMFGKWAVCHCPHQHRSYGFGISVEAYWKKKKKKKNLPRSQRLSFFLCFFPP